MPNEDYDCIKWIENLFGECVSTPSEQAGFFFGLLSTVIWMYAQIPQIIMNFKRKSVDGLSFSFICFLNVGDTCNLIGALINGILTTQIITVSWFLIVDLSCLIQYIWYNWIQQKCNQKKYTEINNNNGAPTLLPVLVAGATAASSSLSLSQLPSPLSTKSTSGYPNPYEPPHLYGSLLGWISAISYMSSRMPQIITNFKRKRTEGLSIQFFWSAVCGNVTYAMSIFLKDYHWGYIWAQFPWLMGSAGILVFDFIVLVQFLIYRNNHKGELTQTTDGATQFKPYIADQLY